MGGASAGTCLVGQGGEFLCTAIFGNNELDKALVYDSQVSKVIKSGYDLFC